MKTAEAVLRIVEPIAEDLLAVDRTVSQDLKTDIGLIQRISSYIVASGGKRVRPIVLLLIARALGCKSDEPVFLASMVEYVHTASLLHDDVVDESDMRRGKPSASFRWGNSAAVLAGDFMYSRAFELMVQTGNLRVCEIVASAVNRISEGEVIQLQNVGDTTVTDERYFEVIERKTGVLFEAAARLACVAAGASHETEEQMANYAKCLGRAFQIIDDALDYAGSAGNTGKTLGNDLKEGKMTMPLIHALRVGSDEEAKVIREAIRTKGGNLERVVEIIERTGAIAACVKAAEAEVARGVLALSALPDSAFKKSLIQLLSLTVKRDR